MCRSASLALAPELSAPSTARRWLASLSQRWELPELCEDLSLATSELVTNAVLHARTPIEVTITVASPIVEVVVHDEDAHQPVLKPVRDDLAADILGLLSAGTGCDEEDLRHPSWTVGPAGSVAAGRGLQLIEALTDRWGVRLLPGDAGKDVWFVLAVPPSWPHGDSCVCNAVGSSAHASGPRVTAMPGPWD